MTKDKTSEKIKEGDYAGEKRKFFGFFPPKRSPDSVCDDEPYVHIPIASTETTSSPSLDQSQPPPGRLEKEVDFTRTKPKASNTQEVNPKRKVSLVVNGVARISSLDIENPQKALGKPNEGQLSDAHNINHSKPAYFSGEQVYSCTFVYIIALLQQVAPGRVKSLKAKYQELTASTDELDLLVNHNIMHAVLCKHLEDLHHALDPDLVDIALKTDRKFVAARIGAVLGDRERRRLFMEQKDDRAQSLLNLMQSLLDGASLELSNLRPSFITALIQLSRNSGLYPERLLIKDVTIQDKFASANGRYGDVYEGKFGGRTVAVKTMRGCGFDTDAAMKLIKAFAKEAVLWAQLSSPYVLPFYGVYPINANADRLGLISPWMKNGNLTQYLDKTPPIDRLSLIKDIALGLNYLHSFDPQVIHGDLKGPNILITDDHRACVADFGLCLLTQNSAFQVTMTNSSNDRGTFYWMAPELLNDEEECVCKNCATDVYAFGCVSYEIFNGQPPFFDLRPNKARIAIKESRVPPRPTHRDLDDTLWMLILRCLHRDPSSRPSMSEVSQQLSTR